MKQLAHLLRMEWIPAREQGATVVCLRPMVFNDEDIRQVRMQPDPGDYMPIEDAARELCILASKEIIKLREQLSAVPADGH